MKNFLKVSGVAGAALVAGTMAASAATSALIDFTDNSTGFSGAFGGNNWVLTGSPVPPNVNENGRGPEGVLLGENDGVGIKSDEIAYPGQFVTLTFDSNVRLTASYFLDLYISKDGTSLEVANITNDIIPGFAADANVVASDTAGLGSGYQALEGLALIGSSFTFWATETNDFFGKPDFALGAVTVEVVPLPAGFLLLGTALGGLGLARRKRKA